LPKSKTQNSCFFCAAVFSTQQHSQSQPVAASPNKETLNLLVLCALWYVGHFTLEDDFGGMVVSGFSCFIFVRWKEKNVGSVATHEHSTSD
jgi:hypothetical protein